VNAGANTNSTPYGNSKSYISPYESTIQNQPSTTNPAKKRKISKKGTLSHIARKRQLSPRHTRQSSPATTGQSQPTTTGQSLLAATGQPLPGVTRHSLPSARPQLPTARQLLDTTTDEEDVVPDHYLRHKARRAPTFSPISDDENVDPKGPSSTNPAINLPESSRKKISLKFNVTGKKPKSREGDEQNPSLPFPCTKCGKRFGSPVRLTYPLSLSKTTCNPKWARRQAQRESLSRKQPSKKKKSMSAGV
jgi:hypothetical protein